MGWRMGWRNFVDILSMIMELIHIQRLGVTNIWIMTTNRLLCRKKILAVP